MHLIKAPNSNLLTKGEKHAGWIKMCGEWDEGGFNTLRVKGLRGKYENFQY